MEEKREQRQQELNEANKLIDQMEKEINRLTSERAKALSQRDYIMGAIAQLDELMSE